MIVFYSQNCEDCTGNHALAKMRNICEQQGIQFQERRTVLWIRFEEEANEIMKINPGLKLPFFYNTETGQTLHGTSFTPIDELQKIL